MKRLVVLALAALLSACAQMTVQKPLTPTPSFAGPRLEEGRFVSFDGARLGLTTWTPAGEPWAVIVGVHGMDDYANAFHLAAPYWASQSIATYAYDQRGFGAAPEHGRAPGPADRDDLPGAAPAGAGSVDRRVMVGRGRAAQAHVPADCRRGQGAVGEAG